MTLFAQIQDPINFKDIIQDKLPLIFKFKYIFRHLLKYSRDCFDICLYSFLLNPFFLQHNNPQNNT